MGQQRSPDDRVPPAPDLPQPHDPQEDTAADLPSAAPALDASPTVPEMVEALVDRLEALREDLEKLLRQLKDPEEA